VPSDLLSSSTEVEADLRGRSSSLAGSSVTFTELHAQQFDLRTAKKILKNMLSKKNNTKLVR